MASRVATSAKSKVTGEIYRGYMPIGLPQHEPRQRVKPWWKVEGRPRVSIYPKLPEEKKDLYTDEPQYPPLNDGSPAGLRRQVRLDWYDTLKRLPTAEMKMHEVTKHVTHYTAHFHNWLPNYNSLPMAKYMTRTHLVESLPSSYQVVYSESEPSNPQDDSYDELHATIEDVVLDQIALDLYQSHKFNPHFVSKSSRDGNRHQYVSNRFIENLVSGIRSILACEKNKQLLDYQFDLAPAIRSWWYHSGFGPPNNKVFYRSRKDANGNINQMIQMDGYSALNVRNDSLIEPVESFESDLVNDANLIENFSYPLRNYGAMLKFKRPVSLPGFWFEEVPKYDCPHTMFLSTDCLNTRNMSIKTKAVPATDRENCLNTQAIMSAFGWLNSLSCYHGYTPFQELDYPFTSQVITTNGQEWLFNVYQLNTHAFHRDLEIPARNNICWSSGLMRLYGTYEDGVFKDINKDVIKLLIKFMSKQTSPAYTQQLNLRPYLGTSSEPNSGTANEEEMEKMKTELRNAYEQRENKKLQSDWFVPLFEHVFFRHKDIRQKITDMKPKWHLPKPKYPKIFE